MLWYCGVVWYSDDGPEAGLVVSVGYNMAACLPARLPVLIYYALSLSPLLPVGFPAQIGW